MGEQRFCLSVSFKRKAALAAGGLQKPLDAFAAKISERGAYAGGSVERRDTKGAHTVQMIHKTGIDLGRQRANVVDPAADQLAAGFADQLAHLRRALFDSAEKPPIHENSG
jgi:hypothetical protein